MRWPFLVISLAACVGCKVKDPLPITAPWHDDFARSSIGGDYYVSGDGYEIVGGILSAHGAHNHPLWLRKKLPRDVRIDFDCWSTEQRGDIKIEIFGDGKSYDSDGGHYDVQTGYEVIMGGWSNAKSIIARLDEHGKDVVERVQPKVVPNKHYHWRIERSDRKLAWFVDDMTVPFLLYDDPSPLAGSGHEYFAFNNWETDTWFDNLVVSPL